MMTLDSHIEAILFFKAEPVSLSRLSEILRVSSSEIEEALSALENALKGRGITLLRMNDEVSLGTAPEFSETFAKMAREELSRDLGKSSLETLTIILYKNPIAKPEIDYIRGVNSNYILRSLLVRGLVEKIQNPKDQRSFLYRPTLDLLRHLGVGKMEELPDFDEFRSGIETSIKESSEEKNENT